MGDWAIMSQVGLLSQRDLLQILLCSCWWWRFSSSQGHQIIFIHADSLSSTWIMEPPGFYSCKVYAGRFYPQCLCILACWMIYNLVGIYDFKFSVKYEVLWDFQRVHVCLGCLEKWKTANFKEPKSLEDEIFCQLSRDGPYKENKETL